MDGSYLVLETTNKCSLACVHCSVSEAGHPHHEATGFLSPLLAEALFKDLAEVGAVFDTLILFWLGEPLIHPFFGRIYQSAVRAASTHGIFKKIEVHTNATHLDAKARAVALNDAVVEQVWHFTIDAATRQTYRDIKGMDRFESVESNVAAFVEALGRCGSKWPRPVFQFILSEANVEEADKFRRRWEQACQRAGVPVQAVAQDVPGGEEAVVFFRQLDCPTPEEQARQNRVYRRAVEDMGLALVREDKAPPRVSDQNLSSCSGFWKSPVVGWNGEVTVCTRDNRFENSAGNIRDTPFSRIWWGDDMEARRGRVASGNYEGLPPCATCFIPRSSNYTDILPEEIQAHAQRRGA